MKQGRFLSRYCRRWLLTLLLVSTPALTAACAVGGVAIGSPVYSSLPIIAHVIDKDTGQPLEGVIIVARWKVERTAVQSKTTGQLMVAEAVTNVEGEFRIPAWGPRPTSIIDRVTATAPELLLFKSGYESLRVTNKVDGSNFAAPIIQSQWNGKTIKLKKFIGSDQEWAKQVRIIDTSIDFAFQYQDCSWKYIPRMIVAIHREEREFAKKQTPNNVTTLENRERNATLAKCGSIQEFLRSYFP